MELLNARFRINDNIPWRIIEGQAFVIDPRDSVMYPLNSVSTRIWELLKGKRKTKEITSAIHEEFEVDEGTAQKDVLAFLHELLKAGFISKE